MVTVSVPATTANLGPGFDTLGLAVSLHLKVEMDFSEQGNLFNFSEAGSMENPEQNLVYQAARHIMQLAGKTDQGLYITTNNEIPVGKGLGSSAAAIIAGMCAANELLGRPFDSRQILNMAVEMEGHPDNIVPAMAGGFTASLIYKGEVLWQRIAMPAGLKTVLAVPDFMLPTHDTRSILPETISLHETVNSLQKTCYLLASIANGQLDQLQPAMDDELIQTRRKAFIPGFDEVLKNALAAGAKGVALSGAGPSIVALTMGNEQEIGSSMQDAFSHAGVNSRIYILEPCQKGIQIG